MKTATSLALVAIGAILAFAITRSPSWLNLQVVGWVLMVTGAIGAVLPRRGDRLAAAQHHRGNRRCRSDRGRRRTETTEPASIATETGNRRFNRLLVPGGLISSRRGLAQPAGEVKRETIEEYIEE